MNDIVQAIGVGIALVLAAVWVVRRLTRKRDRTDSACNCGCQGCPLQDKCGDRK